MIKLRLYNNAYNAEITTNKIELYYKINIVTGNSGSGKSFFLSNLDKALNYKNFWGVECNKDIVIIKDINTAKFAMSFTDKLIVIDENEIDILNKGKILSALLSTPNYFLLLDRDRIVRDVNVNAVFEFEDKEVINGIRTYVLKSKFGLGKVSTKIDKTKFEGIVTEDITSGRLFWDTIFSGLRVLNNKYGSGEVYKEIKRIQNSTSKLILVALDYDCGAKIMKAIYDDTAVDKSKLIYISMEAFEEVICNSEFILQAFPEMRDRVINYKDYLDATYKHAGKYFSKLLHSYVKQASPYSKPGDKNYEKFYEKGMTNFKECFLDECCAFKDVYGFSCKLQTVNKRDKLLNNKFETLNQLR